MAIWIIEPHEPLIFRDGRPFGATPGAIARSLAFPFPATVAGGVRSQAGIGENGIFRFPHKDDSEEQKQRALLKRLRIRGPLLVQLARDGQTITDWLIPAPCDALLQSPTDEASKDSKDSKESKGRVVHQLVPLQPLQDVLSDLATTADTSQQLALVGLPRHVPGKVDDSAPKYWRWTHFQAWLQDPTTDKWQSMSPERLGQKGPHVEERVHVSIDPETRRGRDGFLFGTSGLEFTSVRAIPNEQIGLASAQQLALAVILDNPGSQQASPFQIQPGTGYLGGERRLVNWSECRGGKMPKLPDDIKNNIVKHGHCRLVLMTPAYFEKGYLPTWLLKTRYGVTPELKAITNRRPHVVSGWDIIEKQRKPSRRLAPAGTVLFLQLHGKPSAIKIWLDKIWFHTVSDDDPSAASQANKDQKRPDLVVQADQYRLDGFGLAALGTWSGTLTPFNIDSFKPEVKES